MVTSGCDEQNRRGTAVGIILAGFAMFVGIVLGITAVRRARQIAVRRRGGGRIRTDAYWFCKPTP